MTIYLNELGLTCALGGDKKSVLANFLAGEQGFMQADTSLGVDTFIGRVNSRLPDLNVYGDYLNSRNNQLALQAYEQIEEKLAQVISALAAKNNRDVNIAVVIGTSTSGIASGEDSMQQYLVNSKHDDDYHYSMQEMVAPANFIAKLASANSSVYSISTACTSSAKALISAQRLLESGLADIVIAGGVDSLCKMTINGFNALESISSQLTLPFQSERCGINIGEGAAFFVMSHLPSEIILKGFGESSDAHHISAPDPEAKGAVQAMQQALERAGLFANDINYINLHATGTMQNDAMEAKAVADIFSSTTPCSASKQLHGHCLGAAGAIEAGLCWLLLSDYNQGKALPVMKLTSELDEKLDEVNLLTDNKKQFAQENTDLRYCMSNSYAFGGNNASLILAYEPVNSYEATESVEI